MKSYFSGIQSNIKKNFGGYFVKRNIDFVFIIVSVITGMFLDLEMINIAFFAFVIWLILNPWKSQDLARVALLFLVATPFSLVLKKAIYAEQFAIYAYYFLIFTIIKAIWEKKSDG